MPGHRMHEKGFSLIELLVVVAVFATVSLVIVDIFVNVTRAQQRTLAWQEVQAELRYTMELLTQAVRSGQINYEYAGYETPLTLPQSELALVTSDGDEVTFKMDATNCIGETGACVQRRVNGGPWYAVTGNTVEISRLDFYITPFEDPYEPDEITKQYMSSQQPIVAIVLEGRSQGDTPVEQRQMVLQTSVASRYYAR